MISDGQNSRHAEGMAQIVARGLLEPGDEVSPSLPLGWRQFHASKTSHTEGAWRLRPLHTKLCFTCMAPFGEAELLDAQCCSKLIPSMATHWPGSEMTQDCDSNDEILSDPEEIKAQEERLECCVGVMRKRCGLHDGATLRQVAFRRCS